jgi:hypothetical protein
MNSDKESEIKKENNPLWKVVVILSLTVTFGFHFWLYWSYRGISVGVGFLAVVPFLFILYAISFIAVLLYIFTQRPQGIAKVILYAVLIPISIYLLQLVYVLYMSWCYLNEICH